MSRPIDYVSAAVLLTASRGNQGPLDSVERIREYMQNIYGIDLSTLNAKNVAQRLMDLGIIEKIDDVYAGNYFKSPSPANIPAIVNDLNMDAENIKFAFTQGDPLFSRAFKNEMFWQDIDQTDEQQRSSDDIEDSEANIIVPASDRIVRLNDNQIRETNQQAGLLIKELEIDNGNPDYAGLRERLLGQLKAGRELIQAGEFRAYLLYEVLVKALNELIRKYGNPAIAALANALLGALVSNVFQAA